LFSFLSYHPTAEYYSYNGQFLKRPIYLNNSHKIKRHSITPSSSIDSYKMQQTTMNESAIGVPGPLCSVCGDISTGKYSTADCRSIFRAFIP